MKKLVSKIIEGIPRKGRDRILRNRAVVVFFSQTLIIILSNIFAFALRFEGNVPPLYVEIGLYGLPLVVFAYWVGLVGFGIQRGLWRYVGFHDLGRILLACMVSTIGIYVLVHGVLGWSHYPRSVIILTGLLCVGFLAGVRVGVRWFREWLQITGPMARRVLIVGAGQAGELLVRDIFSNPHYDYRPVAFVDDDPVKQKAMIHGVPVLGKISDIPKVVDRCQPHEMIVAIPSGTPELQQKILSVSELCRIPIKTLPSLKQLFENTVSLGTVRPMRLEDLLQREPVWTDLQELRPFLEGRRVLVTGAGGSIGSELCRQILGYRPKALLLLERHENSAYEIHRELRRRWPHIPLVPIVGDIGDEELLGEVLRTSRPDLIFHAAAHKQVPLMEENPAEAVRNNVFGTQALCNLACESSVEQFIFISTDKAVNPENVMGGSKRAAELLMQVFDRKGPTRFTTVRFGNVLGSSGSVVPLFAEQIHQGGPVTVTHPDIRRFFMTIPEAVQLVLQASVMGEGGDVLVLEMGDQIRIADLARHMIVLSGMVPDKDIKIEFTKLREGEKLQEELFGVGEQVGDTRHQKIKRAVSQCDVDHQELLRRLEELRRLLPSNDKRRIKQKLLEMTNVNRPSKVP